jgi:hypothetical protein
MSQTTSLAGTVVPPHSRDQQTHRGGGREREREGGKERERERDRHTHIDKQHMCTTIMYSSSTQIVVVNNYEVGTQQRKTIT